MPWWRDASDGWINSAAVARLEVFESGSTPGEWLIRAKMSGEFDHALIGSYPDKNAAIEAARKLCQGIDPSTITGG